jgi:hypothetical protein
MTRMQNVLALAAAVGMGLLSGCAKEETPAPAEKPAEVAPAAPAAEPAAVEAAPAAETVPAADAAATPAEAPAATAAPAVK